MSSLTTGFVSLRRWTACGVACWLLLSPTASASAQEGRSRVRTCEAPKKAKSSSGRGRRTDKSKSASQEPATTAPSSTSSSSGDDSDDLAGIDDVASPAQPAEPTSKPDRTPPVKPARVEPVAEPESDTSSSTDDASASQSAADTSDAAVEAAPEDANAQADDGPSVLIDAYAGFGIATRSVRMPRPVTSDVLDLEPGVTPAAEVGLRVTSHPNAPFSFYVHLVYQSALGFTVAEHPPLALPKEVGARSERVALEFAPRWHLASSKVDIAIPLGATVRTLWAEVHTSATPSFSLVGPHLRVEAVFSINDVLSLRLSPELHYIMLVDADLRTAGVSSMGPAIGGDVSVDARLSQVWSFGINYRESHASLAASRGSVSFRDVERYLTLRAQGSF